MQDDRYFKHEAHARHNKNIKPLIKKYGMEGYGVFWVLIETLRCETGYKFKDEEISWEALSDDTRVDVNKLKEILSYFVKCQLLTKEDGFFYSESFLEKMACLDDIRQKRAIAGKKGGLASKKIEWEDD